MHFRYVLVLLLLLTAAAHAQPMPDVRWDNPALWKWSIGHTLDFFDQHAWDEKTGSYACDLAVDGSHTSETRYLIAVSRMIYGLAHGGRLDRAQRLYAYLKGTMTRPEAGHGPYFLADTAGTQDVLVVNQQAYGMCGMVALLAQTHDAALRADLQIAADEFYRRFHDPGPNGGFFDGYDLRTGRPVHTKSYNSTVYVATSFLAEMDRAMTIGGRPVGDVLTEIGDIVSTHFLDAQTGWIVENFTEDWKPQWRDWQLQGQFTIGVTGHNFQAAWLLMRLGDKYDEAARTILQSMLKKPVYDREHGGVFDVFQRETDQHQWHTNKPWWQNCEAILACTHAIRAGIVRDPEIVALRDRAVDFYFHHFVDPAGGEFDTVTPEGQPTPDATKGNAGKSTYHTVEMARYMQLYLGGR